ncbi:succinate-semialdehyde dehydrogenase/glutarate-semialdehyde dehydrogenase [Microbacterium phyllosphaerae]|uniref:Succinate-semialdehyde dehydrogenase/glutarate-semialdehyde dehydrogenase n=1 Tax=Microbacterium phyllosphaerae TaxID=124798 RepID=A0ABS4WUK1_9MICO|nr:NAD-dependent succinate-semialdehyde dehydrogenase [Microbacterium phyllosphaerae]MBP2379870.1 succinate-semialdehyde dehydrogenase/glutarate-semialdehyde dehydrogenase [Microbacterium phyllosphaerae]
MSAYRTINPTTGETLEEHPVIDDAAVEEILARSADEYARYRTLPLEQRTATLRRAAELFRERMPELAEILTVEMGKPTTQARGEVALVASIFEYYADNAARFLAEEELDIVGGGEARVRTEPIGALLGIMPWNYPYYQVARFAAPNLALGNTIVLKHARNCPRAALALERVLHDAGVPADAYINAFIDSGQVAGIIADDRIRGVSLTGSEAAGAAVGEVAGRHMKKYVLELGGSDPFIVLDDADIEAAVAAAVVGRFANGGQACTASKRFIVVDAVYDEFTRKFIEAVSKISVGDPTDPDTFLGPLSSTSASAELDEIVRDAVDKGATLYVGPQARPSAAFYPPTVLTEVTPEMRAYEEELFGPAAVVYRVASPQAAVQLANSSPFGLSSSIFTRDAALADTIAEQLEAGMVWINSTSKSAPDLPFGGVKRSGVGRELARFGIDEFANKKLVRVLEPLR